MSFQCPCLHKFKLIFSFLSIENLPSTNWVTFVPPTTTNEGNVRLSHYNLKCNVVLIRFIINLPIHNPIILTKLYNGKKVYAFFIYQNCKI